MSDEFNAALAEAKHFSQDNKATIERVALALLAQPELPFDQFAKQELSFAEVEALCQIPNA
jgi:hypothetical protein